jgi:hypothetical protein
MYKSELARANRLDNSRRKSAPCQRTQPTASIHLDSCSEQYNRISGCKAACADQEDPWCWRYCSRLLVRHERFVGVVPAPAAMRQPCSPAQPPPPNSKPARPGAHAPRALAAWRQHQPSPAPASGNFFCQHASGFGPSFRGPWSAAILRGLAEISFFLAGHSRPRACASRGAPAVHEHAAPSSCTGQGWSLVSTLRLRTLTAGCFVETRCREPAEIAGSSICCPDER